MSLEILRQRISNKLEVKSETAFNTLDQSEKGYLVLEDFKEFLTMMNVYPAMKNVALVYERFDKD